MILPFNFQMTAVEMYYFRYLLMKELEGDNLMLSKNYLMLIAAGFCVWDDCVGIVKTTKRKKKAFIYHSCTQRLNQDFLDFCVYKWILQKLLRDITLDCLGLR